jgi:hypothetical protein
MSRAGFRRSGCGRVSAAACQSSRSLKLPSEIAASAGAALDFVISARRERADAFAVIGFFRSSLEPFGIL